MDRQLFIYLIFAFLMVVVAAVIRFVLMAYRGDESQRGVGLERLKSFDGISKFAIVVIAIAYAIYVHKN